jgi:hypothetical protein
MVVQACDGDGDLPRRRVRIRRFAMRGVSKRRCTRDR